jgi:hypothetical protein
MTYATEFFAVQQALEISIASPMNYQYSDADAQFASRIQDSGEKEIEGMGVCRAIFVDGQMVVCQIDGQMVDADAEEVKQFLF